MILILWALGIGPFALGNLVHLPLLLVVVLVFMEFASRSRGGTP